MERGYTQVLPSSLWALLFQQEHGRRWPVAQKGAPVLV